jgi:flagellar hook-associated protein 3 FlgL
MFRVSTNMPNDDIQYTLRRKESNLAGMQDKIASQNRIRLLRDDPMAASHAVRYESYLARMERYETNNLAAKEHYNYVDGNLQSANGILQRIRELAVTGANGVYTEEDTRNMAVEVNELLKELVSIANQTGPDGKQLFAGDKAYTVPFRIIEGTVEGAGGTVPVNIEYRGAGSARRTEIHEHTYSDLDISGGEAFWAERMNVISSVNANNFSVQNDTSIFIDGNEIALNTGDSVYAIAAKINDSPAPVKAYIDPETQGLSLLGTDAHLINLADGRLPDGTNSAVLQDLGLTRGNSVQGAPNFAVDATVSGGSAFDMVIRVRDALYRGDTFFTGGAGLAGIDSALTNLGQRMAEIGSRAERVEQTALRLNTEIPNVTETLVRETGLDIASAAVALAELNASHQASLQVAAKILPQTLLDFLR